MLESILGKKNIRYLWLLVSGLLTIASIDTVTAERRPLRTLTVKIVADQHFASQEVWKRKASRQIEDIAEEIRGLIDVDLRIVGYEVWRHDDEDNLYDLAARLIHDISPDSAEAVIGFTYVPCPPEDAGAHTDGVTIPFRGMMIRNYHVPCPRNRVIPYAIIHEMIHLFGGVHIGRGYLMSPVLAGQVMLDLDPINRRIVRRTRDIDFVGGYTSLDSAALKNLAGLYLYAIENGNRDIVVLFNLGEIYTSLKDFESAVYIYGTILTIDSTVTRAWIGLADVYARRNNPDSAVAILQRSLGRAVDSGAVFNRMAHLFFEQGDYERAYGHAVRAAWAGFAVDSVFRRTLEDYHNSSTPEPDEN